MSLSAAIVVALAALFCAEAARPLADHCRPPELLGSAPVVLAGLASAWENGFKEEGGKLRLMRPFRPPQGALDPALGRFLDGQSDFALLTREIAEVDLARFRASHGGRVPVIVPVAGGAWDGFGKSDAVAVIVHRSNPLRWLTLAQLDAVFSLTRYRGGRPVRTWGDLGLTGAWRDRQVQLVGGDAWADEESARALTLRRHVMTIERRRGRWRQAPDSGGEAENVARVARNGSAISFTGMGHVTSAVRALAVAGEDDVPVFPDAWSARTGRYPLLRTIDLLVAPAPDARTVAFARYLIGPKGQALITAQGEFMELSQLHLSQADVIVSDLEHALRPRPRLSLDSASLCGPDRS